MGKLPRPFSVRASHGASYASKPRFGSESQLKATEGELTATKDSLDVERQSRKILEAEVAKLRDELSRGKQGQ
jgi:hypothetical protein